MKPVDLSRITVTAAGYFLLAKLSLDPPFLTGDLGRIVWPASGLALALVVLCGKRLWPAVAIGAFATTIVTSDSLFHAVATSIGNTLEIVLALHLLERMGFHRNLERVGDVLGLVVSALLGATASAVFGVLGLHLGLAVPAAALPGIFWKWSLGHAMGILIVTPFLLTARAWMREIHRAGRYLEPLLLGILTIALGKVAFGLGTGPRAHNLAYLLFPVLIWAAFRCGPGGAAAVNLLASAVVILETATGAGPFVAGSLGGSLLLIWSFVNVTAVTTLLLAAVLVEGRRAQDALRQSERQYRMLVEQAADGIIITDAEGACTDVNGAGCEMLGYEREELPGRLLVGLVAPADREAARAELQSLSKDQSAITSWRMERRDGTYFPAEVSVKRFEDGRLQAFIRDVTERRMLEEQLRQSQKMEAVGILAGGIAHDFNNLLTAIIGHTEFARQNLPPDHQLSADIDEVGKAAARAAELTRQLLAFARKQIVEPKLVVLDELVAGLETMLRRVVGENVELRILASEKGWSVRVDPVQLEQVVLNIAINAKDVMPKGGRLTLECGTVEWRSEDNGGRIDMLPGPYATLTVTDTGTGMSPDTLKHVFEPFFTTKDRRQGTGLGLAVSYGIIKQAGGYIWASSTLGRGSTFRIFLPRTEVRQSLRTEEPVRGAPAIFSEELTETETVGKGETILLIEDEPLVRELAVEVLHAGHYNVLTACDGEEALTIAREHPSEIHLTVTDVVLPVMSGKEVAERLREARPGLKVLFMSGYAEEEIVHQGIVDEDVAFLSKPFTPAALHDKVRGVLDGR